MNCAICNENAEFHCLCQNISLCKYHSWYHKDKLGHRIEQININFSSFLSPDLRKEILKRLKKIKESKLQISSLIKSITLKIENSSKETLKELDSHYEFYLNLLSFEKLPKSMPNEIENMISFSLRLKKISKQLKETFEEVFNQSLVSFVLKDDQFSQNDKTPDKKIREDLISIESYFKKKELQINTEEPILRDPKKNRNTYKNLRERNPFRSIFFMSFVGLNALLLICIVEYYNDFNIN